MNNPVKKGLGFIISGSCVLAAGIALIIIGAIINDDSYRHFRHYMEYGSRDSIGTILLICGIIAALGGLAFLIIGIVLRVSSGRALPSTAYPGGGSYTFTQTAPARLSRPHRNSIGLNILCIVSILSYNLPPCILGIIGLAMKRVVSAVADLVIGIAFAGFFGVGAIHVMINSHGFDVLIAYFSIACAVNLAIFVWSIILLAKKPSSGGFNGPMNGMSGGQGPYMY